MSEIARASKQVRRLMITGAGGFVGQHLIKAALDGESPYEEILACAYGGRGEVEIKDRVSSVYLDILDHQMIKQTISDFQPTHIVHLAAISHVMKGLQDPHGIWSVNVIGTLNLLENLQHLIPNAVLLFASSSEIYGRSFQSNTALDEHAELHPRNPYATTKAAADLMALQYADTGLHIIRARPFNHVGRGQSEDFVIPTFAAQIARIEAGLQAPKIKVGNLNAARDFLDVRDIVQAYLSLLDLANELPNGSAFNICSGKARSVQSILESLIAISKVECEVEIDPKRMRPSDTPVARGNAEKIKKMIGWLPRYEWTKTLSDVLNDWRKRVSE